MKILLCVIALFINVFAFSQNIYTVNIRVEDQRWRDGGQEWRSDLYADIYNNGILIPTSNNYYYEWFYYRDGPSCEGVVLLN